MPKRYARHYYDLFCMTNSIYKDAAFKNIELLPKVVEFKQKFYPRGWAHYENATSKTIKLIPDDDRIEEIRTDYKEMQEMFFGTYPEFDYIIAVLRALEDELHKL